MKRTTIQNITIVVMVGIIAITTLLNYAENKMYENIEPVIKNLTEYTNNQGRMSQEYKENEKYFTEKLAEDMREKFEFEYGDYVGIGDFVMSDEEYEEAQDIPERFQGFTDGKIQLTEENYTQEEFALKLTPIKETEEDPAIYLVRKNWDLNEIYKITGIQPHKTGFTIKYDTTNKNLNNKLEYKVYFNRIGQVYRVEENYR